ARYIAMRGSSAESIEISGICPFEHSCWRCGGPDRRMIPESFATILSCPMQLCRVLLSLSIACCLLLSAVAEEKPPAEQRPVLVTQEIEGWSVVLGADILQEENRAGRRKALTALANHLQRVRYIVPEDRLEKL